MPNKEYALKFSPTLCSISPTRNWNRSRLYVYFMAQWITPGFYKRQKDLNDVSSNPFAQGGRSGVIGFLQKPSRINGLRTVKKQHLLIFIHYFFATLQRILKISFTASPAPVNSLSSKISA